MAVWFMPWLHCGDTRQTDAVQTDTIPTVDGIAIPIGNDIIAPAALRRIHPVSRRIPAFSGRVGTPANDRRHKLLRTRVRAHALNHGGAMD
jgi:hypothetical protein